MIPLVDCCGLDSSSRAGLEAEVAGLTLLQDVVRRVFSLSPPGEVADVVIQDEYTHDVIVRWRERCYLVFDTT